jgi:hypothetical protein
MKFPAHKAAMMLTHNEHLNCYVTVQRAIEAKEHGYRDWVSDEQKQKAIDTNECWFLQWYPETAVGFCILAAADLDVLLEGAQFLEKPHA